MVDTTLQIPGYCVTNQIYCSSRTLVYRAIREDNQQPVVIKLMRQEYPRFNELVHFRNQYTIAKNLKLPGIIQLYSLENYQNGYALVMEDFGAISLKEYMSSLETRGGVSLEQFFHIALQIADALEKLHFQRLIHKDIKPANILINPQTKQVKLTDFSIASLLPKETQTLSNPNVLEGTLAYLSPEQTGRMNRGIDYRSDFYSLGVTLFEFLTGEMPFNTSDAMELIYCHIAKLPPLAHSINPKIPPILSSIVNKLMAKMAEDRYQSARGLKYDLQTCLHTLETTGSLASFQLGKRDIPDRFIISEKLYGRQTEVETLLAAFNRVSAGATEIMLVAGCSGIGKTVVVNEVHKPIVRQKGYFIQGKFDQFGRNIPFLGLVQAFRDLMVQLLSESPEQIKQWKAKILEALGEQGRVIIDVIPEVELLIGKQPPISPLEPGAAQNRFNLVFQNFIRLFTNTNHPLVMFLDDLQWTDLASLKLIQLLMGESETNTNSFLSSPNSEESKGGLLLIGSYRDNEVSNTHPLMLMLEEIRKNGATVNTITLSPLSLTNLNLWIADTLSCPEEVASPLTQLVHTKTKGNPFFSHQFLRALYEYGLISCNFDVGYWQCDIAQATALSLTDDVMELMALQLQKLPKNTQETLKLAACIGNQFDLETLAIVHEKSSVETAMDLWKALQEGFIIPKNENYKFFLNDAISNEQLAISDRQLPRYKFLHDRVQQAAYFLIPENQKQSTHLKIGQLLLKKFSLSEREEKIFDIVNQLNAGIELITDRLQRKELAELNLIAGRKAKSSTAYAITIKYLTVGIELLGCDRWETNYEITLALYETLAEAAYLNGDMEQMEESVEVVLIQAKTLLDKMKAYHVKIEAYKTQSQGIEAITTGIEVLKLLGIELPQGLDRKDIEIELQEIQLALTKKKIKDLIHFPQMTDSTKLAVMNILWRLLPVTYVANPLLFTLIVLKQVNLSLKYGNCVSSTASYATYGIILWSLSGDIDSSYEFGQLALNLLTKFKDRETECMTVFVINTCIIAWKNHLKYL
ncbi:serine/threonine-protein kinase PknK [Tolypothrix bouteillei]|uniref:ATP-binding protein n=1 Tax=Tolypothrix bouteillei TaxID=1246981 RepID=UPI003014481F